MYSLFKLTKKIVTTSSSFLHTYNSNKHLPPGEAISPTMCLLSLLAKSEEKQRDTGSIKNLGASGTVYIPLKEELFFSIQWTY